MSSEEAKARYISAASTFQGQQYSNSFSHSEYLSQPSTYSGQPGVVGSAGLTSPAVSRSNGHSSSRSELTFQHGINLRDRGVESSSARISSLDQEAVLKSYDADRVPVRYSNSSSPLVANPYKHLHTISRHPYEGSSVLGSTGAVPSHHTPQVSGNTFSVPRNSPNMSPESVRSDYDQKEFSVKAEKGQQIVTGDHLDASLMKTEIHIPHSISTLSERDLQNIQEMRAKKAIATDLLSNRQRNGELGVHGSPSRAPSDGSGPGPVASKLSAGSSAGNSYAWSLSPVQTSTDPLGIAKDLSHGRTGQLEAFMDREHLLHDKHASMPYSSSSFPPTFEDPNMQNSFRDVSRKSGLLWRKPERGDMKSERCRCTLEDGIFEVQMLSTVDMGLDEAFDLTQWSLDERFSFREQIALVDNSRNRLMKFDADSVDLAEEWRMVLRNSSPGQYQHISKHQRVNMMVSTAKNNMKSKVLSAWKNNIFVKARRLESKVFHRLIDGIWREWCTYRASKKQRRLMAMSPEMEAMELERSLGISRLYLAHWKVVTSRCCTAMIIKEYSPARQATASEEFQFQLRAGQVVALLTAPEQGWAYGMRLPSNRWEAVKTNLWQVWFPMECVEVINDGRLGYWGRAGPMSITVIGARNLPQNAYKKRMDSYCTVHVHSGRRSTDLRRNTLNPDWVQNFAFDATEDDDITVMVWEWDRLKRDELIGYIHVPSQQMLQDCEAVRMGNETATSLPGNESGQDVVSFFKGGRGYKLFDADGDVLVGADQEESVLFVDCVPMRWDFPKREVPEETRQPSRAIEAMVKEQASTSPPPQKRVVEKPLAEVAKESPEKKSPVPKLETKTPPPEPQDELPHPGKPLQDTSASQSEAPAPRETHTSLPAPRETSTSIPAVEPLPSEATPEVDPRRPSVSNDVPQVLYPPSTTPRGSNPAPPTLPQQTTPPQPAAVPQQPAQSFASPFASPQPLHSAQHAHPARFPAPGTKPSVPAVPQLVHQNLFPKKFRIILVGAIGLPKRWIGHYDHSVIVECRNVASGNVQSQQTKKVQGQNVSWEEYFDFRIEDHASSLHLQVPQVGEAVLSAGEIQKYADQCTQPQPPLQWMGTSQGSGSHKLFQTMTQRYPSAFPCPLIKANTRSTQSFKNANPVLLLHVSRLDPPAPMYQSPPPAIPQQSTPPEPHQQPQRSAQPVQPPAVSDPNSKVYLDVSMQDLASKLPSPKPPPPAPVQPLSAPAPAAPAPVVAPQPPAAPPVPPAATATKSPPAPAPSAEISQTAPVTKTEESGLPGKKVQALALSFMDGTSASVSQSMTPRSRADSGSVSSPRSRENKSRGPKADLTISESPGPKGFTKSGAAADGADGDRSDGPSGTDFGFKELSPRQSPRYVPPKDLSIAYPVTLEVTVVGARYLPFTSNPTSTSFCFLQVGESKFHTRSWSDTIEPQWKETFVMEMVDNEDLVVSLIQSNDGLSGQFVGVVRLSPERIIRGYVLPREHHKAKRSGNRDARTGGLAINDEISLHKLVGNHGRLAVDDAERFSEIALRFKLVGGGKLLSQDREADKSAAVTISAVPGKDQGGLQLMAPRDMEQTRLYLRLAAGRNLPEAAGLSPCNPYCKVRVGEHRFQSQVCLDSLDPEWKEDLEFVVSRGDEITITVLDWDFLKMDRVIGVVKVSADQLLQDSADAQARAEQNKNSFPTEFVLQDSSGTSANISSSTAFKNMSLTSAWKYGSSSTIVKAPTSRKKPSEYNSSRIAFSGEMHSRKSGLSNFKVFSSSGFELKSGTGLQTCLALRCQSTPFVDDELMAPAATPAPSDHRFNEAPTPQFAAIENGNGTDRSTVHNTSHDEVQVDVVVLAARNLPKKSSHGSAVPNSYCILQLGAQTKRTSVKNNSQNPVFCEELQFSAPRDVPDLFVTVMNKDKHVEVPLGVVQVPVVAMKDSARRAQMEEALSGLSFIRPRDEAKADEEKGAALSPAWNPIPTDCQDVPDSLFHRRYPGMKNYDLSGANGALVVDQEGRKTSLLLRCLVADKTAKPESSPGVASKEAPVALSMKFSGDIQESLVHDDAQLSKWKKQLRADIANALDASKQRFGVVSVEVNDGVVANLVVLPLWMLPGLGGMESKTARALSLDLISQVQDPNSRLRTSSPYLARDVEIVNEDSNVHEGGHQHDHEDSSADEGSVHSIEQGAKLETLASATESPPHPGSRSPAQASASPVPPRPQFDQISSSWVATPEQFGLTTAKTSPPRSSVPQVVDFKAAVIDADPNPPKTSPVTLATRPATADKGAHLHSHPTVGDSRRSASPEDAQVFKQPLPAALPDRWVNASIPDEMDEPPAYEAPRVVRGDFGRRERKQNAKRWYEDRQFRKVQSIVRGWLAVARQSGWSRSHGYSTDHGGAVTSSSPIRPPPSRAYGDFAHSTVTASSGHQTMVDVPVFNSDGYVIDRHELEERHIGDENDITKWAMIKCAGCGSYKRRDRVSSQGRCKKCERQTRTLTEGEDVYREGIC